MMNDQGKTSMRTVDDYDVVIIGAGLAGLSLARQLLLNSEKRILLVEKRAEIPMAMQKVGEATVQLSAYYFSKVLDLEEHLLREHFLKYNLRFYWKSAGKENRCFEDYSQSYIRTLSNIATYQLDRNKLEGEMLRLNLEHPNFTFHAGTSGLQVSLSDEGPHSLSYKFRGEEISAAAVWVVDTSGRGKFLERKLGLARQNSIHHGAHFFWVEGLLNIEKLTDLSPKELRLKPERAAIGHLPFWLATNHFCGEGFWFWVIPLQGKTSLGLVYDSRLIDRDEIASLPQLIEWVCREFPLFARDLPFRKVLCHSALKDFSHDCTQTISASRWALAGEAGRFTDPLYSPGGDLISLYNTLITDAILTDDANELAGKARLYEQLMQSFYEAYVPSFAVSYDALGDQEAMTLKYSWELTVYFAFYVFPFINDLFTDRRFLLSFVSKFARLGPINKHLQSFISGFYHWKKENCEPTRQPVFNDFMEIGALRAAESTFYRVGVPVEEARQVLEEQLGNLRELARFIIAHVHSVVLADEDVLTNRAFIESLDLEDFRFDEGEMRECYAAYAGAEEKYEWAFDPTVLRRFHTGRKASVPSVPLVEEVAALAEQGGSV
ncbi:MAG: tryptophan 7-halogenase [Acidobacteria bacterium]|nr:tryptophan 7-halogenase [Acidobacteriota bacterium]